MKDFFTNKKNIAIIIAVAVVAVAVAVGATLRYDRNSEPQKSQKIISTATTEAVKKANNIADNQKVNEKEVEKPIEITTEATEQQPVQSDFVDPYNEEKEYNKVTIDQDFTDDCFMVRIKKAASVHGREFTAEDFPGIDIASVKTIDMGKDKGPGEFHIFCIIYLENKGKQEVLDAISIVEQLDFVQSAQPNMTYQTALD